MEDPKISRALKKSLHSVKKESQGSFPLLSNKAISLPWEDRINAIVRNPKYRYDAARFLLLCQNELSKFPEEEREKRWITHFPWDHQNPVVQKWRLPWFINPFDADEVELPLLALRGKKAKWGTSLSTPKVVGIEERRFLILEVDLAERKKDIMASLGSTVTYYQKFFNFYRLSKEKEEVDLPEPKIVNIQAERFLILEVDLTFRQKKILTNLASIIGKYRKIFHFHYDKKEPRKKTTRADPWEIWDQVHICKKNLNVIAKERAGSAENPTYDNKVAKEYQVVRNALHQAENMIQQVEPVLKNSRFSF